MWGNSMENLSRCCVLLLMAFSHILGQDEPDGQRAVQCSSFMGNDTSFPNATIVTEDAMEEVDNDIQAFVNCTQPFGVILFSTPIINTLTTVLVDMPMTFGTVNGTDVVFNCPTSGSIFDIRSPGVTLSNMTFANCTSLDGAAPVHISNCTSFQPPVRLENVQFQSNANSNGTAGLDISLGCNAQLKNASFFNNSGLDGTAIDIKSGSLVSVTSSNFHLNVAASRGGAIQVINASLKIRMCNFTSNKGANGEGGAGGAIYIWVRHYEHVNSLKTALCISASSVLCMFNHYF
ncbi:unnamed protein product [Ostreobium quekettii]|uniref:Uncharacterized protein n=1 Tax=Ostreobium quekettii TaxID=121088 RepID=A0A8S1IM01_9CHLO|nr:unnamed protein product [Ostreobium quekettii]